MESWQEARTYRNMTNEACCNAKNTFVKRKLNETAGKTRKFWETLTPLISENKIDQGVLIELKDLEGNPNVATAFNSFFINIGDNLQKKILNLNESEKEKLDSAYGNKPDDGRAPSDCVVRFKFRAILDIEIKEIVINIKINKSSGISGKSPGNRQ